MKDSLNTLRAVRTLIRKRTSGMTDEQFWAVPTGYNASIGWHVAHLPVTLSLLAFGRSGQELPMGAEWITSFRKGTGPADATRSFTREEVMEWLDRSVDLVEDMVEGQSFGAFDVYTTSAGVTLNNLEEALAFLAVHDGIHFGYILAQARAI